MVDLFKYNTRDDFRMIAQKSEHYNRNAYEDVSCWLELYKLIDSLNMNLADLGESWRIVLDNRPGDRLFKVSKGYNSYYDWDINRLIKEVAAVNWRLCYDYLAWVLMFLYDAGLLDIRGVREIDDEDRAAELLKKVINNRVTIVDRVELNPVKPLKRG